MSCSYGQIFTFDMVWLIGDNVMGMSSAYVMGFTNIYGGVMSLSRIVLKAEGQLEDQEGHS